MANLVLFVFLLYNLKACGLSEANCIISTTDIHRYRIYL